LGVSGSVVSDASTVCAGIFTGSELIILAASDTAGFPVMGWLFGIGSLFFKIGCAKAGDSGILSVVGAAEAFSPARPVDALGTGAAGATGAAGFNIDESGMEAEVAPAGATGIAWDFGILLEGCSGVAAPAR